MKTSITKFADAEITGLAQVTGGCCPPPPPCCCEPPKHEKQKGNNGFGHGGDDPAPGNSGHNGSPNANQKLEDRVR
jgi:hypothetical protein